MTDADGIPGQVFGSVWEALEDSPADAATMRLRCELMNAVRQVVAEWGVSGEEAARRLHVTRPRLAELQRGRIGSFTLDGLTALAARAGLDVHFDIRRAA